MALTAQDFPAGTPLRHFFAWNEARWRRDRRYRLLCRPERAPQPLRDRLVAAVGNPDIGAHAAVFAACEDIAARRHRRIMVIRLSALGDFIQSLGPFAAIRRHHADARITLLTTRPFAEFARELGPFDDIIVDGRPGPFQIGSWLALRRCLRAGRFDRVYDLQTADRSSLYALLLRPGLPEWSGIAAGCSHPHANLDRDPQHTLDKQAEQLLMAGMHPTPLPALPPLRRAIPDELQNRSFVLLVPGSSPQHPAKRWPAKYFGLVAQALHELGDLPVIVGSATEAPLAETIRLACPTALDLTGRTDLGALVALAQHAVLTIGNDTGVCHVAAAAGCPVIVLFSDASDPSRCAPRGGLVKIFAAVDLADLAADAVINEGTEILRRSRPADDTSGPRATRPHPTPNAGETPAVLSGG